MTYILYPAIAPSFLKGERTVEEIPVVVPVRQQVTEMPRSMEVEVDGEIFSVRIVSVEGSQISQAPAVSTGKIPRGDIKGGVKSNMQGMVLDILVSRGGPVKKGDVIIVLEAMKMENPISSPVDGKVVEIYVDVGDTVQNGDVLVVIE